MGTISPQQAQDGVTGVNAASINAPVNTIANEFNGNIDNSNIKAGANIATAKLATDAGITSGMIGGFSYNTATTISNPYKFHVNRTAAVNTANGAFGKITFDTELFDTNSNFATGTYTAPVAGFYHFSWNIAATAASTGQIVISELRVNSTLRLRGGRVVARGADNIGAGGSGLVQLSAADAVEVYAFGSAAFALDVTDPGINFLNGFLMCRT